IGGSPRPGDPRGRSSVWIRRPPGRGASIVQFLREYAEKAQETAAAPVAVPRGRPVPERGHRSDPARTGLSSLVAAALLCVLPKRSMETIVERKPAEAEAPPVRVRNVALWVI